MTADNSILLRIRKRYAEWKHPRRAYAAAEWVATASNTTLAAVLEVLEDPQSRWHKKSKAVIQAEAADRLRYYPDPEKVLEHQRFIDQLQRHMDEMIAKATRHD